MADRSDEPVSEQSFSWREPAGAFIGIVAALAALAGLAMIWGPLADHILAVAALVFLAVPFFILRRRDADFSRFGIDLQEIPLRHIGIGLAVTVGIFPLYAVGHHLWETGVEQRQSSFDVDNYRQWSVDLETPPIADGDGESIKLRTVANRLYLEWRQPGDSTSHLVVDADRPFFFADTAAVIAGHYPEDDGLDEQHIAAATGVDTSPAPHWYVTPSAPATRGHLVWSSPADPTSPTPQRLVFDVEPTPDDGPRFFVGTRAQESDAPIEIERTHWWIVIWALTHLILVALPEEYFYRGYLQTRIADLLGHDIEEPDELPRFLGFSSANWITSGLFAVGHLLIPIGGVWSPARAAVFFPSLLFGWLRERTGSIIAPTVFHAGANMMVLLVVVHYY